MSQNGKGDADRVRNRAGFRSNHESIYGLRNKSDGRKTVIRISKDGSLFDPRSRAETFISVDPCRALFR